MSLDFSVLRENGLDVDTALKYTGGGARYIKALTRFYNAYDKNRTRIEKSYNSRDYEDYAIVVHSLKSNARMIGDSNLGDLAEKLQYAGQDGDEEIIRAETDNLLKMYEELVGLIEPFAMVEENKSTQETIKVINELKSALEDYDYNKSTVLFEQLLHSGLDDSSRNTCNKIRKNIEQFQYEEAANVTGELIEYLNSKNI